MEVTEVTEAMEVMEAMDGVYEPSPAIAPRVMPSSSII